VWGSTSTQTSSTSSLSASTGISSPESIKVAIYGEN